MVSSQYGLSPNVECINNSLASCKLLSLTPSVLPVCWYQQVNHSPSFNTDSEIDREIKETLIYDTLRLVNFEAVDRKKCLEEEKRKMEQRLTAVRQPKHKFVYLSRHCCKL